MNKKIYLHETIQITLDNRANYFKHMTVDWAPTMKDRKQKMIGIFGTFSSTGNWPEVINLWEYDGWSGIAASFDFETANVEAMRDPFFAEWSRKAYTLRHQGFDRILIPADFSPTIDDLIAIGRIGHRLYYHERVSVRPGQAKAYLSLLEEDWLPVANELGMELVGAYRTSGRHDSEVVVIWAVRDWATYATIEEAYDSDDRVARWRHKTDGLALDWRREVLCAAPLAPCFTGKHLADF